MCHVPLFASMADEMTDWISANLVLARQGRASWLGPHNNARAAAGAGDMPASTEDGDSGCLWCKSDILKALTLCCWAMTLQAVSSGCSPVPFPQLLPSLKKAVVCLHQLWRLDESSYIDSLAHSPVVQRRYIWTFRQITTTVKPFLNLNHKEGMI